MHAFARMDSRRANCQINEFAFVRSRKLSCLIARVKRFPGDLLFRRATCNENAVVNYGFASGTACRFACVQLFRQSGSLIRRGVYSQYFSLCSILMHSILKRTRFRFDYSCLRVIGNLPVETFRDDIGATNN